MTDLAGDLTWIRRMGAAAHARRAAAEAIAEAERVIWLDAQRCPQCAHRPHGKLGWGDWPCLEPGCMCAMPFCDDCGTEMLTRGNGRACPCCGAWYSEVLAAPG